MGLILFIIVLAVGGLAIGGLGRLLHPGPDPMSLWQTMGLGVVAELVVGLVVYPILGVGGLIPAIVVAVALVWLWSSALCAGPVMQPGLVPSSSPAATLQAASWPETSLSQPGVPGPGALQPSF